MQTLEPLVFERLTDLAQDRGVSIQELVRAVIIPEWMRTHGPGNSENERFSQFSANNKPNSGLGLTETNRPPRRA